MSRPPIHRKWGRSCAVCGGRWPCSKAGRREPNTKAPAPTDGPLLFVGENNPYGADPRFALFDEPPGSAGGRFRRLVLAIPRREYFEHDRINLLQRPRWSLPAARAAAAEVMDAHRGRVIILLGRKVSNAFGGLDTWETRPSPRGTVLVSLPHPSGLCRVWQEPGAFARARRVIEEAAPWVTLGTLKAGR